MKAISCQGAKNSDTFEKLANGRQFTAMNRFSLIIVDVYTKIDADTVQASDGRQWKLWQTSCLASCNIAVPQGSYSYRDYVAKPSHVNV